MFNARMSIGSAARENNSFRASLGNSTPRYNSEVTMQRKKYFINSTRNSEQVPEWMSRTQTHYHRSKNSNKSLFINPESPFNNIRQTYVYSNLPKPSHLQGQFQSVKKARARSRWEMKGHTFDFEWPATNRQAATNRQSSQRQTNNDREAVAATNRSSQISNASMQRSSRPSSRQNIQIHYHLPKYGIRETPLHIQKETPIKIGHPYMLNSTYIH